MKLSDGLTRRQRKIMKKAYWIEFKHRHHIDQHLMLSEFELIRMMLKEGRIITYLKIVELNTDKYKSIFGI